MNIQYYRKEKGMTIQQLADAAELPKRTVEQAIARNTCSVKTAIKLADALGVTLDALCRDDPDKTE
ncbi:MAG: helix-turn-helix transcriptional regulator [Oscillospiraceae bacterium]|nr:helix-turn-helix transcriptional regulator [Oscillospiraceae bacterium]